jgi:RNA polymerase sigma-70 factor (ECF subfamily)
VQASVLPLERSGVSVHSLDEARDADLLRRIAGGDEESFRALYRRYGGAAYSLARRVVRQEFLAEEIVQETFLALWRGAGAYDATRGSVRTWLLSSIHHRAVDSVRREEAHTRRAQRAHRDAVPEADVAEDVADALDRDDDRARLGDALVTLPREQRQVVDLMYYGALTQAQIAERLSLPLGTVKSRCLLAMRRLRSALAREEPT